MPRQNRGYQVKERKDRPGVWEVGRYTKGKWKRCVSGIGSAEEAELERYKLEKRERSGYTAELNERLIRDTIIDYIEERRSTVQSKTTFDIVAMHLANFWADHPLSYISEGTCNAYYTYRNDVFKKRQRDWNKKHKTKHPIKDISNATVGRELRQLRAMIKRDFDMGRITKEPKVFIKKESYKSPDIPTKREVMLMARAAPVRSCRRQYILISFYTGARKSAVLGLKWPQVKGNIIDFHTGTESNKGRSRVPIAPRLGVFLRIWRTMGTELGPVIHRFKKPIKDIKETPTSIRHAAAVHMLRNGVAPYDVAKYLGNSVEMIYKHYGQYIPDYLQDAASALQRNNP